MKMKNALAEQAHRLNRRLAAHTAVSKPISSIPALCVVAICAATIASFSQTQEPGQAEDPIPTFQTISRTITDSQGRQMIGEITAVNGESKTVKFKRKSDAKEFTIKIETLSTADQNLILDPDLTINPPKPNEIGTMGKVGKMEKMGKMKSSIEPGKRVILALPFEKQTGGGTCAAAATLNILKFLDPQLKINQLEMFTLFNSGKTGASPKEVIQGIQSLGFCGNLVLISDCDKDDLKVRIVRNLNNGRPMIVATRNHAMTLVGYNVAANGKYSYYQWDQRMRGATPPQGLPQGVEELSESELTRELVHVMFIEANPRNITSIPAPTPELAKEPLEFVVHQIINPHHAQGPDSGFFERAANIIIRDRLGRGERVFIQTNQKKGKEDYLEITADAIIKGRQLGRMVEEAQGKIITAAPRIAR